ncbi:MAG TPA: lysophospholipid acyltransferase family protein [Candidatus Manganitrophaceae bacterium]|nr:lysophospholipid acyltransferase family protein [Candidatus Manganitrophaceae bacterium]
MLYRIAHVVVYILARVFFRLKVIGEEHVPGAGGVLVAANHNSYFDIPFLGCALRRRADNIAKSELFENRIVAAFFRALGGFPVKRGRVDRMAMQEAVDRLKAGRLLAYYPEGTRSKDGRLQPAKSGIGLVVAQSGAVVVPAYIRGTGPVRLFRPVTVLFGKPLDFKGRIEAAEKEGVNPKELYVTISQEIMGEIALLERSILEIDR